ncbi:hypothetical protein SAMN04489712_112134 [Thermomonospora echinospora]|uniref:Histidine kinase n=1 Tax=Thermomonospora echinospora TaxID=1992 RepID=A0A1H6D0Q5_9ACTN|nr:hypothetical protein [Thermomonospora echinospora]SEG78862.1 hypothetical protein SAMN04489712_112134 [Thermomonospora echinospora]
MTETSAASLFAVRFNRAFDVATVIAVAVWQTTAAFAALLVYLGQYRSPEAAVALWALQLLIIAVGAALLIRGVRRTSATWLLIMIDLAIGAAMAVNCPGEQLLKINWAWATVGLIGVLLLLHRPMRELVSLLAVNAGVIFFVLLAAGNVNRHTIAGFVTLLYASASIQLAMMAGARVFRFSGGMAAEAAAERWEIKTREGVIAEVAAARQARYQMIRALIAPILRGLSDGTVDPADPGVQHRCATAEAVLRQLLAEREDASHPLLRILQPGIDAAVHRGAVVDTALVGELPPMTEQRGYALAGVPLAVLATARRYVRVTVVSTTPGHVSISVLTDGDVAVPGDVSVDGVTVTTDHDGDLLWLEARWERS